MTPYELSRYLLTGLKSLNTNSRIYRLELSKMSILGFFWPSLKLLLIPFFAYISFGTILEAQSVMYGVPYRAYVLSGLLPWLIFSILIGESIRIWSSPGRRVFLLRANNNCLSMLLGALFSYWPILSLMTATLAWYVYQFAGIYGLLIRFGTYVVLMLSFITVSVVISWITGLMSASTRDVRQVVPYFLTGILFVSPIYFESQKPDSSFEVLLNQMNVFSKFLKLIRDLIFGETPNLSGSVTFAICLIALASPFFLFISFRLAFESYIIRAFSQAHSVDEEDH